MIEARNLSKSFGSTKVVDDISFTVKPGEVLGFLGPNGAGKSTTMKMITGFLRPSEGDALVHQKSILTHPLEVKQKIGYVPESAPLYNEMSVREFLHFIMQIRQIQSGYEKALELCSLKDVEDQSIETLSKGFRRRVSLAQALIHDPDVLILDEPTDGLDPNQKHDIRKLIKQLSETKSFIISTHILEEVEAVCDRCLIISHGKKLFDGTAHELKSKSQTGRVDDVFRAITTGDAVPGVNLE